MNWILIIIAIIAGLILFELIKHHFRKSIVKYLILIIFLVLIIMVSSAYYDFSTLFEENSSFVKTGNVVKEKIEDKKEDFQEKDGSFFDKIKYSTDKVFNSG